MMRAEGPSYYWYEYDSDSDRDWPGIILLVKYDVHMKHVVRRLGVI
jgi:hypothetical protein